MIYFSAYPPYDNGNPAIKLFHNSLVNEGLVHLQFNFTFFNILKNSNKKIALIFHWPSYLWRSNSYFINWIKLFRFIALCVCAKFAGYKLIWSAHNTLPHEYKSITVERIGRLFMLRYFNLIVNHSYNARLERMELFGSTGRKEALAIHGHYEDEYVSDDSFSRNVLHLPYDAKVFFLQVNGKQYKGDAAFVDFFISHAKPNQYLVLMGKVSFVNVSEKVRVVEGYLSNSEMASLIQLSDFVVLPYNKITTSGAFMLAVTLKKPIIASRLPFFEEHMHKGCGLLFDLDKQASLLNIFEEIYKGWIPDMQMLYEQKKTYTWEKASKNVFIAIQDLFN